MKKIEILIKKVTFIDIVQKTMTSPILLKRSLIASLLLISLSMSVFAEDTITESLRKNKTIYLKKDGTSTTNIQAKQISDVSSIPSSEKSVNVIKRYTPMLETQMKAKGMKLGDPIIIRIFKVPSILEVWVKKGQKYILFKRYNICNFSGRLGPKTKSGDKQSPEGFYSVTASALNPNSSYYLSFNLGYPNDYDRLHGYTGSLLMVHGECASVGCYAMSNARMSEIYTIMHAAFSHGQKSIQVQAYPFALTYNNMRKVKNHPSYAFWLNLKQGYELFERTHQPLFVTVVGSIYTFRTLIDTPSIK